jgi:hypothetical protein|nr:MAG TPA: hypothetical protein [Caudoviricetes sp.]
MPNKDYRTMSNEELMSRLTDVIVHHKHDPEAVSELTRISEVLLKERKKNRKNMIANSWKNTYWDDLNDKDLSLSPKSNLVYDVIYRKLVQNVKEECIKQNVNIDDDLVDNVDFISSFLKDAVQVILPILYHGIHYDTVPRDISVENIFYYHDDSFDRIKYRAGNYTTEVYFNGTTEEYRRKPAVKSITNFQYITGLSVMSTIEDTLIHGSSYYRLDKYPIQELYQQSLDTGTLPIERRETRFPEYSGLYMTTHDDSSSFEGVINELYNFLDILRRCEKVIKIDSHRSIDDRQLRIYKDYHDTLYVVGDATININRYEGEEYILKKDDLKITLNAHVKYSEDRYDCVSLSLKADGDKTREVELRGRYALFLARAYTRLIDDILETKKIIIR